MSGKKGTAGKKDKAYKEDADGKNPYGIRAPAITGPIFKIFKDEFCTALTKCPTTVIITSNKYLTTNLECSTTSFTLDGAKLNGNGFTITLDASTINLQNGAKLEDIELVSTGNAIGVNILEGGGTVENVSIRGNPLACVAIQGTDANFKTVTLEQVTCRDFRFHGVLVDVSGPGAQLDKLVINHATFASSSTVGTIAIFIRNALPTTSISVESVWATGDLSIGLLVEVGASVGEMHVDGLTIEDCTRSGLVIGQATDTPAFVELLKVTNSNFLRCSNKGIFLATKGDVVLENIFVKDNSDFGIFIDSATNFSTMDSKILGSNEGVFVRDASTFVMDNVLVGSFVSGGVVTPAGTFTTAVLKDIAVLNNGNDNGEQSFTLVADAAKLTVENLFACNGKVEIDLDRVVVRDFQKSFVASEGSACTIRLRKNFVFNCEETDINFEACDDLCTP
jgi:hypothetical protein